MKMKMFREKRVLAIIVQIAVFSVKRLVYTYFVEIGSFGFRYLALNNSDIRRKSLIKKKKLI